MLMKQDAAETATICYNCGDNHIPHECPFPDYILCCNRCLVISFDGSGHKTPCGPINTVSLLRKHIQAETLIPMFKIRMSKDYGSFYYLSGGLFEPLAPLLVSAATQGIFSFQNHFANFGVLSYLASHFSRLAVVVAVLEDGMWRLRFRLVPTATNGCLVFKLYSTLNMENQRFVLPEGNSNTVLVVGIKPTSNHFKLNLRIYANKAGFIDRNNFDGQECSIGWTLGVGRSGYQVNSEVDADKPRKYLSFSKELYDKRVAPLVPLRSQRLHEAEIPEVPAQQLEHQ